MFIPSANKENYKAMNIMLDQQLAQLQPQKKYCNTYGLIQEGNMKWNSHPNFEIRDLQKKLLKLQCKLKIVDKQQEQFNLRKKRLIKISEKQTQKNKNNQSNNEQKKQNTKNKQRISERQITILQEEKNLSSEQDSTQYFDIMIKKNIQKQKQILNNNQLNSKEKKYINTGRNKSLQQIYQNVSINNAKIKCKTNNLQTSNINEDKKRNANIYKTIKKDNNNNYKQTYPQYDTMSMKKQSKNKNKLCKFNLPYASRSHREKLTKSRLTLKSHISKGKLNR